MKAALLGFFLAAFAVVMYIVACMQYVPMWLVVAAVVVGFCSLFFSTEMVERERLNGRIYAKRQNAKRISAAKYEK